jgi:cyclase
VIVTFAVLYWFPLRRWGHRGIIEAVKNDENLTIYTGGGCNSAVLCSEDGQKAVIVDTKYFEGARRLREEIKAKNITIINTHFHMDHARGNRLYPGAYVISGNIVAWWQWYFDTAFSRRPDKALEPGEETVVNIDQEKIHILCMGRAHSLNDCIVYFENRKLLMAGDLIWGHKHPVLIGSDITSWRRVLKVLENKYEFHTLVPGHGDLTGKNAVVEMEEYFDLIAAAVGDKHKLRGLRDKFKDYDKLPVFSGVDRVAVMIKRENNIGNK